MEWFLGDLHTRTEGPRLEDGILSAVFLSVLGGLGVECSGYWMLSMGGAGDCIARGGGRWKEEWSKGGFC